MRKSPKPRRRPTAPRPPRVSVAAKIRPALEALLFSSARPVRESELAEVLEATPKAVAAALASARGGGRDADAGVRLESVAGGWRFVTRPEFDSLLRKFHEVTERSRLSLAALETLAIIAYRQPITLPEIQDVRGVNSLERAEDSSREEAGHDRRARSPSSGRRSSTGRPGTSSSASA